MHTSSTRLRRFVAGALVGATGLALMPSAGFTGVASAADLLPPVLEPTGPGSVCDGAPAGNAFTDVDAASAEVVNCLVQAGITTGTTATTFSPNATVTRRQMALFVKRQIDLANDLELAVLPDLPPADGALRYSDVATEGAAFREAIDQLAQAGIVGGFPDGTYRPGARISRRQMAAFVNRTQEFLLGDPIFSQGDFFDDDNAEPASVEQDFNGLASVGIFQGDGQGNVTPGGDLTRRQMANILLRYLQFQLQDRNIGPIFGPSGNQAFVVTSQDMEMLTVSDAAAPTRGARTYTVAVPDGETVSIGLFDLFLVGRSEDGFVSFFDDDRDGSADGQCQTRARIERVDGAVRSTTDGDDCVTATSAGGSITFTVNSGTPDELVRPVVWAPSSPGGPLTVDGTNCTTFSDREPRLRYCGSTVPVGVGGTTLYVPEEATAGTYGAHAVVVPYLFDGQASITGVDQASGISRRFLHDADDDYRIDTTGCGGTTVEVGLAIAEFGGLLSLTRAQTTNVVGDDLSAKPDVITVQYVPGGVSIFTLTCDRPSPTSPPSAEVAGDDVTLSWLEPSNPDITAYDVYRAPDVEGATFTKIGSVADGTTTYTDANVASGTYRYLVLSVSSYSRSENSGVAQVTVPAA